MKRMAVFSFLVATVVYAATDSNLPQTFRDTVKTPSTLARFRNACPVGGGTNLNFDGDDSLLKALDDAGTKHAAQVALIALKQCTDGASSLALRLHLGNEFLLAHPAALLEALGAETVPENLYSLLAEGEPTEFFAVDCKTAKCEPARKAAFAKKRVALNGAKVTGDAKTAKEKLLRALVSDR